MAVGRVSMWNYKNGINDLCWINGFSEINDNPIFISQLKRLDKNRNKHFKRFKYKIRELENEENDKENIDLKTNRQLIYFGKPFSDYYRTIAKKR